MPKNLGTSDSASQIASLAPETVPEVIDPANEEQREKLLARFTPLFSGTGGIDSWLRKGTPQRVVDGLDHLDATPLPREQLNQLLFLSHEPALSEGFFQYYWLGVPPHPYDVRK